MKGSGKHIVEGVIILLIAMFIFSYFTDPVTKYRVESTIQGFSVGLKQTMDKLPSSVDIACNQEAQKLIPGTLTYKSSEPYGVQFIDINCRNDFIDGKEIDNCRNFNQLYRLGNEEGENVNHYYYKFLREIEYSKQVTDPDGTVLGTNTFTFKPIIKEISGSEKSHSLQSYEWKTKDYEVVDSNIITCEWV